MCATVDHVRYFAAASFSLLQQFCTVGRGIFNIAAVNILLSVNKVMHINITEQDFFQQVLNCSVLHGSLLHGLHEHGKF